MTSANSAKERIERKVRSKQSEPTGAPLVSATQASFTLSVEEGNVEREAMRRRGAAFPDDRKVRNGGKPAIFSGYMNDALLKGVNLKAKNHEDS